METVQAHNSGRTLTLHNGVIMPLLGRTCVLCVKLTVKILGSQRNRKGRCIKRQVHEGFGEESEPLSIRCGLWGTL